MKDNFLACYRGWSSNSSCRYALARYRYRIYNQFLTDMPWLDTGIESGIGRLQICPGWIPVSNLQSITHRYALARYRNRIWNSSCRHALAGYRNWIYNQLLTDMPWLDTGIESLNSSCRYPLAGYRYRIYNQLLTDMPWLDTGIESGIAIVDSNHLWIVLFPEKARHQLYAMSWCMRCMMSWSQK